MIQVNDCFSTINNRFKVISLSKTGKVLHAKNYETDESCKFTFYNASGLYIKKRYSKRRNHIF